MKTTAKTIKSQLDAMSGTAVQAAAPVSQLARFVQGEIKGGEAKHNFIMTMIASAIVQALKGNQRDIPEAIKLCAGKSKKSRAFMAGFQAICNDLKPEAYKGKYDAAENAEVRARVVARSASLEFEFEAAFLSVMSAPTEPKAPKAKAKAKADDATSADETSADDAAETSAPTVADLSVSDVIGAAVRVLDGGMATAEEVQALRLALLQHDNRVADAALEAAMQKASAETATA